MTPLFLSLSIVARYFLSCIEAIFLIQIKGVNLSTTVLNNSFNKKSMVK